MRTISRDDIKEMAKHFVKLIELGISFPFTTTYKSLSMDSWNDMLSGNQVLLCFKNEELMMKLWKETIFELQGEPSDLPEALQEFNDDGQGVTLENLRSEGERSVLKDLGDLAPEEN